MLQRTNLLPELGSSTSEPCRGSSTTRPLVQAPVLSALLAEFQKHGLFEADFRGGNRQANAAFYRVVIIRMRAYAPTLEVHAPERSRGKEQGRDHPLPQTRCRPRDLRLLVRRAELAKHRGAAFFTYLLLPTSQDPVAHSNWGLARQPRRLSRWSQEPNSGPCAGAGRRPWRLAWCSASQCALSGLCESTYFQLSFGQHNPRI